MIDLVCVLKRFSLALVLLLVVSAVVSASSQTRSPSLCTGQWNHCGYAFADDNLRATAYVTPSISKTGNWKGYGFALFNSNTINSVRIKADFFASNKKGFVSVKVSGDGGNTFGPAHVVGGNTNETLYSVDVTNDLPWTASKLNGNDLVVKGDCIYQFNSSGSSNCDLDWVPVTVDYTNSTANCTRANPFVTVSPPVQNGTAGESLSYSVNVTNLDGFSCGASNFSMSAFIPSGWLGVFSSSTLAISPFQSALDSFNLTSASNATVGNYSFEVDARNSNALAYLGRAFAVYNVK